MKSVEFCYWLQGMFEIVPPVDGLSQRQVETIKRHLDMVFIHEIDKGYPAEQQASLDAAHTATPKPPFHGQSNPVMRC
jgi:hypothetical protein